MKFTKDIINKKKRFLANMSVFRITKKKELLRTFFFHHLSLSVNSFHIKKKSALVSGLEALSSIHVTYIKTIWSEVSGMHEVKDKKKNTSPPLEKKIQ